MKWLWKSRFEKVGRFRLEVIKRSNHTSGFELLPRRWVVERTFA
ncbi:transposase [Brucella pituitosa]